MNSCRESKEFTPSASDAWFGGRVTTSLMFFRSARFVTWCCSNSADKDAIEGLAMDDSSDRSETQHDAELKGTCPFCLRIIDVHLDIKDRPYWRCWRCEVRMFATKTAFKSLRADGWIWTENRPLKELRTWLRRVARAVGLGKRRTK